VGYNQTDGMSPPLPVPDVMLPSSYDKKKMASLSDDASVSEIVPDYDDQRLFNNIDAAFNQRYYQQVQEAGIEMCIQHTIPKMILDHNLATRQKLRILLICHGNLMKDFLSRYNVHVDHVPKNLQAFRLRVPLVWENDQTKAPKVPQREPGCNFIGIPASGPLFDGPTKFALKQCAWEEIQVSDFDLH
jgi:hypothetical protein